jgi:hypothetical protein
MAGRNAVLKWREDNWLENGGKTINEILIARHLLLVDVTDYLKTKRVCKHPPVVRLFANTRHVFANKIDISVTGHMQTTSVCKFRH